MREENHTYGLRAKIGIKGVHLDDCDGNLAIVCHVESRSLTFATTSTTSFNGKQSIKAKKERVPTGLNDAMNTKKLCLVLVQEATPSVGFVPTLVELY